MKLSKNQIYSLIIFIFSLAIFIVGLIAFISSYQYYSDEYGTDISFSKEYMIQFILGLILAFISSFLFFSKSEKVSFYIPLVLAFAAFIVSFFYFGLAFEAGLSDEQDSNKMFTSLLIGFFTLLFGSVFSYKAILENK